MNLAFSFHNVFGVAQILKAGEVKARHAGGIVGDDLAEHGADVDGLVFELADDGAVPAFVVVELQPKHIHLRHGAASPLPCFADDDADGAPLQALCLIGVGGEALAVVEPEGDELFAEFVLDLHAFVAPVFKVVPQPYLHQPFLQYAVHRHVCIGPACRVFVTVHARETCEGAFLQRGVAFYHGGGQMEIVAAEVDGGAGHHLCLWVADGGVVLPEVGAQALSVCLKWCHGIVSANGYGWAMVRMRRFHPLRKMLWVGLRFTISSTKASRFDVMISMVFV